MFIYIYIYACVYIYIHTHIYIYIYVCVQRYHFYCNQIQYTWTVYWCTEFCMGKREMRVSSQPNWRTCMCRGWPAEWLNIPIIWLKVFVKRSKTIYMVAERFPRFRLPMSILSVDSAPQSFSAIVNPMQGFVPTLMADVDPAIGLAYTPYQPSVLFYKLVATGTVALTECIFVKWVQYKKRMKQQQQRQQQDQQ